MPTSPIDVIRHIWASGGPKSIEKRRHHFLAARIRKQEGLPKFPNMANTYANYQISDIFMMYEAPRHGPALALYYI